MRFRAIFEFKEFYNSASYDVHFFKNNFIYVQLKLRNYEKNCFDKAVAFTIYTQLEVFEVNHENFHSIITLYNE